MSRDFPSPTELIDHRGVMAFVDELIDCDACGARCAATIRADNPFLGDDGLPPWVLIEFIAQSVAIFAGYRRRSQGDGHRHGLLLGCRSMTMSSAMLRVGDRVEVAVEEVVRLDHFGNFRGRIEHQGEVIASGVLSVLESPTWPDSARHIERM